MMIDSGLLFRATLYIQTQLSVGYIASLNDKLQRNCSKR